MSSQNLDQLLKQIREKKSSLQSAAVKVHSSTINFDKSFDELLAILSQGVKQFNNVLQQENLKLEIVSGTQNKTANMKAIQVVLNETDGPLNLLEHSYLLIEGYANSGDIRISQSGSTQQGAIMNIGEVDAEMLQDEIQNFIVKSL